MLVILKGAAPLKHVLSGGTEIWMEDGKDVFPIYGKEYESQGVTQIFTNAACVRCINNGKDYYELPSLETQE